MILPDILNTNIMYIEETFEEMLLRYNGFGRKLFERLFAFAPYLEDHFRFFRASDSCDVWSVCSYGKIVFGVQLDGDIECICIWDNSWFDEVGSWVEHPIDESLQIISQRYLDTYYNDDAL